MKNNEIMINNNAFTANVVNTAKFAMISDTETKSFAKKVALAMSAEDTAKGAQAYFINQIHKRIAANDTVENIKKLGDEKPCKNLPEFCARYFGLSRSQSFNLSRAGSYLKVTETDTGKVVYTDVFTDDFATPNFSNTVLIRFADFIGDTKDRDSEKAQAAKLRWSFVKGLVDSGKINPSMSVNEIMTIVRGTDGGQTTAKESGKADSGKADSGKADSGKTDSGKADSGKAEKKDSMLSIEISEKSAIALKLEMVKFTEKAKREELPMMYALIERINELLK